MAALKKRYKYLLLRDVLVFQELSDEMRDSINERAKSKRPGSCGVKDGHPATVYDAAIYTKAARKRVEATTIRHAFDKADIGVAISFNHSSPEDNELRDEGEISSLVEGHGLDTSDVKRFIHCDDRDSEEYITSVMAEMGLE
ncbi:hypothetical protein AeRB84_004269 [Aphanomyces euteiches]|nr:hypothetical protein AeRB84_004269 [Aphanomyces euteiches]